MSRNNKLDWTMAEEFIQRGGYIVWVSGGPLHRVLLELHGKETYAEGPVAQDVFNDAYNRMFSVAYGDIVPHDMHLLLRAHQYAFKEVSDAH